MKKDKILRSLGKEFSRLENCRSDDFDSILILMMNLAEDIVDEFKRYREEEKKSDSRFRFWTHVPSVERGASSVVIRWRRYTGVGPRSTPLETSGIKDFKMPIDKFHGCTRSEKRAIVHAESRFSKIRKLNAHLLIINKSHNALIDIVDGREFCESDTAKDVGSPNELPEIDEAADSQFASPQEFTEADRIAFRKKIGLDR